MPDWFTHTLIGWITGKTFKFDIALVVIGSLIPDIEKIYLVSNWFGISLEGFLAPIHTPIGAFLIGGFLALFFESPKKTFIPLGIGITTHFIFDILLFYSSDGLRFLFPFSWEGWQFGILSSGDYWITIIAICIAVFVYIIYFYYNDYTYKNNT